MNNEQKLKSIKLIKKKIRSEVNEQDDEETIENIFYFLEHLDEETK